MKRSRSTIKGRAPRQERARSSADDRSSRGVPATDGRAARSERARAAIIAAMLKLLEEGNLRPTAQQVAERARVSLRLVFHHFRDMESLFHEVSAQVVQTRILPLVRPPLTTGPFSERLAAFVPQRARLYEAIGALRRAGENLEPFSPAIAQWIQQGRTANATEAAEYFTPELEALPDAVRHKVTSALSMATSFSSWEMLRRHQGLSIAEAEDALSELLRRMLDPAREK